ncbi:hypothetical protein [Umezawaea sp.]|uniref:hypothetical protein n=1 Tax=Umezawaea sp. TaxID=1955258 RepID=UPI002ED3CFE5
MELVPQHRALFGVDVVGSARNPGYHLDAVRRTLDAALERALAERGIEREEVLARESTGDGALLTLPSGRLGALFDVAHSLENLLADWNRRNKPEVRLRIAVEVGPVGDEPGFYAAKVTLGRLLDASAFKELFERCLGEQGPDGASTALIVSDHAWRTAFGGDHTRVVRQGEFSPLSVRDKEYADTAWVRIPGFDPRTATGPARPEPRPTGRGGVVNQVNGTMSGIQAGDVYGGITFGTQR